MKKERSIAVLNSLIEINNTKIDGYANASKQNKSTDLGDLFFQLMHTAKKCRTELISEVLQLGGKPSVGMSPTGILFGMWTAIKDAVIGKNLKMILNSCEYCEYLAVTAYKNALINNMDDLHIHLQYLLKAQRLSMKNDHEDVKFMQDQLSTLK